MNRGPADSGSVTYVPNFDISSATLLDALFPSSARIRPRRLVDLGRVAAGPRTRAGKNDGRRVEHIGLSGSSSGLPLLPTPAFVVQLGYWSPIRTAKGYRALRGMDHSRCTCFNVDRRPLQCSISLQPSHPPAQTGPPRGFLAGIIKTGARCILQCRPATLTRCGI